MGVLIPPPVPVHSAKGPCMTATAKRLLPGVLTFVLAFAAFPAAGWADGRPEVVDAAAGAWHETGIASYYRASRRFVRTSSGEHYDEMGMTAAHPFLPLGTRVRVTRADTGESIVVRINDRQGSHTRVIDLSYGAARRLGLGGTGLVTLTQVAASTPLTEPVEVAEAPDDDATGASPADWQGSDEQDGAIPRHGRRRRHHAGLSAAAGHRSNHVRFAALVRHSAPHRAARHRL
jgi:rare lipoprotein A (peptidoglycan hydrolase)